MGGLRCAKEIIDSGRAMRQKITTTLATLERQLGCMEASVNLGANEGKAPTYKQQEAFEKAADKLADAVKAAAEEVAKVAADIQATCEPSG